MGLKDKNLDEADYKKHLRVILFLSRPVFVMLIKYTLEYTAKYAASNESTRIMSKEI
jgi:hypothetical protein